MKSLNKLLICNEYILCYTVTNVNINIHYIMILSQLKNVTNYHLTLPCHYSVNFKYYIAPLERGFRRWSTEASNPCGAIVTSLLMQISTMVCENCDPNMTDDKN